MAKQGDEVLNQFQQTVIEEEVEVRDEDKLKIGIIGTGWIAESHIESYKRMKDVKVVAMADLIPGKAEKFAARYGIEGCRFYPDHKSLLDNEELRAGEGRQRPAGEAHVRHHRGSGGDHARGEEERQGALHRLPAAL